MITFFRRTGFLLLLIGIWEAISRAHLWPNFPSAFRIGEILIGDFRNPQFLAALFGSLRRMAIGYFFVVVLGVTFGLLLGRFRLLDEVLGTLAVAIHAIPGAAWVPLAIIWFGVTEQAVIFTILLGATGIVMVSTDAAIRSVPPIILRAAKTMGARGVSAFWHVVVPAAIPQIADGLRLAWAFGWRALMAGELMTSISGLGRLLSEVAKAKQMEELLAIMVVIAGIGMVVDGLIFQRLERMVHARWG